VSARNNIITAGIDAGSRTTKVLILHNKEIVSRHILATVWKTSHTARELSDHALDKDGISEPNAAKIKKNRPSQRGGNTKSTQQTLTIMQVYCCEK